MTEVEKEVLVAFRCELGLTMDEHQVALANLNISTREFEAKCVKGSHVSGCHTLLLLMMLFSLSTD